MANSLEGVKANILADFDEQESAYRYLCEVVSTLLKRLIANSEIEVHSISSRCKTRASLEDKITKKEKYSCLADITDLAGIRVITHYGDDVDKVARIVAREFKVDKDNTLDKRIATDPDRFGYVSLHYVVSLASNRSKLPENLSISELKVEIQIRSILQHTWAEIEHDTGYKSEVDVPGPIRRKFSRLAGLLELADQEFISIRNELVKYSKRVAAEVNQKTVDVSIDRVSYEAFVKNNELSREIDTALAAAVGRGLEPKPVKSLVAQTERLKFVGLDNIGELIAALQRFRHEIVELAVDVFKLPIHEDLKDKSRPFNYGISCFYLCHLLAASRSEKFLDEYLEYNNWQRDPDSDQFRALLLRHSK